MSPSDVSETLLRPGIIRSKYTKSKGLRISAADVAEYIAHLQREAKECPLGKAMAPSAILRPLSADEIAETDYSFG